MDTAILLYSKLKDSTEYNTELEIRFRGMDKNKFENLLRFLKPEEYRSYVETRVPVPGKKKCIHRMIKSKGHPKLIQSKTQIYKNSIYDEWISIVLSLESEIHESPIISSGVETKKERWTHKIGDLGKIDMTLGEDICQVELELFDTNWGFMDKVRELLFVLSDSPKFVRRTLSDCVQTICHREYEGGFCISKRKFQTPTTMTKVSYIQVFKDDFFITPKLDGKRRFLIIFNTQVFSVDLKGMIRKEDIKSGYDSDGCCILDCEYLNGKYYVIDIPVLDEKYIGDDDDPIVRMELLFKYNIHDESLIVPKDYKHTSKDPSFVFDCCEEWKKCYDIDGVIFVDGKYSGVCLKLKYKITIDLYLDENMNMITSDYKIIIESIEPNERFEIGRIYEFIIDDAKELELLRVRDDKPVPNSSKVVSNNMSDDVASIKSLQGRGSFIMRRSHNKMKALMYLRSGVKGSVILDVGTGQGGDITKWKGSRKVYCIEPRGEAIQELERRLRGTINKPLIIKRRTSDYHKIIPLIKDRINIVTLFFCLNMFDNDDMIGLYEILEKVCSKNCKIIGTYMIPDSFESNECYEIRNLEDGRYEVELKGTRISNTTEYFFDFESFEYNLGKLGFKRQLLSRLNRDSDGMSKEEISLTRMFKVFEFSRSN